MGSNLIIGLRLSVIGLSVTFLALGFLSLVMILLLRVFSKGSETTDNDLKNDTQSSDVDEKRLEELAVALAVGICLLERDSTMGCKDMTLGKLLES
jgi:hypothetical protein